MDWFQQLTGFTESAEAVRRHLTLHSDAPGRGVLHSAVNGRRMQVGTLSTPSLAELRQAHRPRPGRLRAQLLQGDVRRLHRAPEQAGTLVQVASQFNLLEMVGPGVRPEDGVTRYAHDATQGPACAIACGGATVVRNWFAPAGLMAGATGDPSLPLGQTATRQIDTLADLGAALGQSADGTLWTMRNGYALAHAEGLRQIADRLAAAGEAGRDALRGLLRIGLHRDVEVTDGRSAAEGPGPLLSQAFCSALPVAYGTPPAALWAPFARLVLEASYEATLLAALAVTPPDRPARVLLTRLGGGAFGNDEAWIDAALAQALDRLRDQALDVQLVSYGVPAEGLRRLAAAHGGGAG